MNRQNFIGVDPGSPVYLALVNYRGELISVTAPEHVAVKASNGWENSPIMIRRVLAAWTDKEKKLLPARMVVEKVSARPGQGVVSTSKYISSYWMLKGIAAGMLIPFHDVAPSKWKHDFRIKGGDDSKEHSRLHALDIWPDKTHLFYNKGDHNKAEAALMALWGVRFILDNDLAQNSAKAKLNNS